MVALFVLAIVLTCIVIDYIIQRRGTLWKGELSEPAAASSEISMQDKYVLPGGIFSSGGHLWNMLLPSGLFKVGVDHLVTQAIGSVDAILLPKPGQAVKKGDVILTLKRRGRELHLKSPMEGSVEFINHDVQQKPSAIHEDQYHKAWLVTLKPNSTAASIKGMMLDREAREWMLHEVKRFKDFITGAAVQPVSATMQDGGVPVRGVLGDVDEAIWKRFENEFLSE